MMRLSNEIVTWFFARAADLLDAVDDSYSTEEAEQEIAWALEDAFFQGVQYGRNNPKKD